MRLRVNVIPGSGSQRLEVLEDGSLRAKVTSRPIGGRANKELLRLLSKQLNVSKSAISISAGSTGRNKLIDIAVELEWGEVVDRLSGGRKGHQ